MTSLLRHPEDVRTLGFILIYYTLALGSYIAAPSAAIAVIPLMMLTSIFSFITAIATHNAVHTPVFKSRTANRVFQVVLTLAYGHPVSAFVPGHNLSHHLHTQSRRDVMRTTKLRFRWNLLNQLLFLFVVAKDITRADLDYAIAMRTERPRWFRQYILEYTVFIGTQLVLAWASPWPFVQFILIPHLFAAWGIVGINFVQHDGCDPDHPYNHSRNLVGDWMNFWFLNNGYHTIHHHHPGLHWSKLPEAHAREIAPHIHPNLDQPSMLGYAFRAYIWPGIRVDYLGNPVVLPEEGPDESWIPGVDTTPSNVSLGAEA